MALSLSHSHSHPLLSRAAALPVLHATMRDADLQLPAENLSPRDVIGRLIVLIDHVLAGSPDPADVVRLEELRADLWDAQIEEDAKSGRLDQAFGAMARRAVAEYMANKTKPLPK